MKGGTIIKLPDGRVGTICYHNLDGYGGIWGKHDFSRTPQNFDDKWPRPAFILREKAMEPILRGYYHKDDLECVGEEYIIISTPEVQA